jgi:polysaccharide chain length determinant protein (PEP-CTERM system associated)
LLGHRTLNVDDYLTILKRRWWLIAIPAVLFPILAYVITFYIPPRYVSTTLVLIEQQSVPEDFVRPVVNDNLDNRLASMKEQILSRSSIEPIIEKYNLYASQKMSMEDRVDLMRSSITIKPIHSEIPGASGLPGFYISFQANDAITARDICGDVTTLFVNQNLSARKGSVRETTDFLKSQLKEAKVSLDDQDQKLEDFERKHFGNLPSDANANESALGALDTHLNADTEELSTMEEQRSFWEASLAQESNTPVNTSGTIVKTSADLEKELEAREAEKTALLLQYTAEYPVVKAKQRQIDDLRKQIADAANAPETPPAPTVASTAPHDDSVKVKDLRARIHAIDLAIANKRKEQENLEQEVKTYQARVESTPAVQAEEKQLTRDYQTSQENYDALSKQITEAAKATDLENLEEGEKFQVKDQANLPDSPTYPKKPIFLFGGLFSGLAIGLIVVALLEYKDTALRSERDIWAFTQLPTLAVIAWSGEIAEIKPTIMARLKRIFSRKPKDTLADATG